MMEMDNAVQSSTTDPGSRLMLLETLILQRSHDMHLEYDS